MSLAYVCHGSLVDLESQPPVGLRTIGSARPDLDYHASGSNARNDPFAEIVLQESMANENPESCQKVSFIYVYKPITTSSWREACNSDLRAALAASRTSGWGQER
jgi:hypothetical protein